MSAKQGKDRGGRGAAGRGGRGRGNTYAPANGATKKGMCAALEHHIFDYGQKDSADQMRTTWDKIVSFAGTTYAVEIKNELLYKEPFILPEPEHTQTVLDDHKETVRITGINNARTIAAQEAATILLLSQAATSASATLELARLQNQIAEEAHKSTKPLPI